jgi:hypothetical protein
MAEFHIILRTCWVAIQLCGQFSSLPLLSSSGNDKISIHLMQWHSCPCTNVLLLQITVTPKPQVQSMALTTVSEFCALCMQVWLSRLSPERVEDLDPSGSSSPRLKDSGTGLGGRIAHSEAWKRNITHRELTHSNQLGDPVPQILWG